MYKKIVDYILSQLEPSTDAEEKTLNWVWDAKAEIIDRIHHRYNIVLESWINKDQTNFDNDLTEAYSLWEKGEKVKEQSPLDDPPRCDCFKDDVILHCLQQMLAPGYIPPDDCVLLQCHLAALWVFYKILPSLMPSPFPLSVVMRLDLTLMSISEHISYYISHMLNRGEYSDFTKGRLLKSKRGKQETIDKNTEIILEYYEKVDISGKSMNAVAMEIQKLIGKTTPCIGTIKDRLKRARKPPFS